MALESKPFERVIVTEGVFSDAKFRSLFGARAGFSRKDVKRMYRETLKQMRTANMDFRVKDGHWDDSQKLKGKVTGLNLVNIPDPALGRVLAIKARGFVFEPMASDVENGLYPNSSIEFNDDGDVQDKAGNDIPLHIDAVALLGTDPPAVSGMPSAGLSALGGGRGLYTRGVDVKKATNGLDRKARRKLAAELVKGGHLSAAYDVMLAKLEMDDEEEDASVKARGTGEAENAETIDLDLEGCRAALEKIRDAANMIRERDTSGENVNELDIIETEVQAIEDKLEEAVIDEQDDDSEDITETPEEDDDEMEDEPMATKTDKASAGKETQRLTQVIEKLNQQLEAERKEKAEAIKAEKERADNECFNSLHKEGYVHAEDRDTFNILCESKGRDFAANHFRAHAKRDTPNGTNLTNGDGSMDHDAEYLRQRQVQEDRFKKNGYQGARLESVMKAFDQQYKDLKSQSASAAIN